MRTRLLCCSVVLLALAACGTGPVGSAHPDPSTRPAPGTTTTNAPASGVPDTSTNQATTEDRATTGQATPGASRHPDHRPSPLVVLDPGHNGGNAAAQEQITKQVPAGRGRTKACNTTGTATAGGYPEHAFNWDVAKRVRDRLTAGGVRVVLTRNSDTGVGPCVHRRAELGNRPDAAAVVSIHADGVATPEARGFHIIYSAPPLNAAQREPALRLARTVRDGMRDAGLAISTYAGSAGLSGRDDLAGLNLSNRPAVLVECGNMRNPSEADAFTSASGRQRYAEAIATGIRAYLHNR